MVVATLSLSEIQQKTNKKHSKVDRNFQEKVEKRRNSCQNVEEWILPLAKPLLCYYLC